MFILSFVIMFRSDLKVLLDGKVHDACRLLDSGKSLSASRVRFMQTTPERLRFFRKFYYPVSRLYANRFGQDAVDAAFEAYLFGFVSEDFTDFVALMRECYLKDLGEVSLF